MLRVLVVLLALSPCLSAGATEVVHHRIDLEMDPTTGTLRVADRISLPPAVVARERVTVRLNAGFGNPAVHGARRESARPVAGTDLRDHILRLEPGNGALVLQYTGRPRMPQAGGGPGEWFDGNGAHLRAGSGWYPRVPGALMTFDLRVATPHGWRALSAGRQVDAAQGWRWQATRPVEDLDVVAGPFTEYARTESFGRSLVWLRDADAALAATYLDAVGRDLPFYARLLGAYPYSKFAVVENLRPTGWGMPSFTLLGSRVMRLPFIPHTSLPHEVLHNWWGNGVLVNLEEGNWSEGLTAYLADHLRAQRRGEGLRHRRDALARFRSAGRNATAPVTFVSRHDRRSQTVGYDKPLMVFHMVRRARGDAGFVGALRTLYREGLGRRVGAREALRTLAPPGEDWFTDWWLRADAPRLELDCCQVTGEAGAYRLRGSLRQVQTGPPYPLQVPVQVLAEGDEVAREHSVRMEDRVQAFEIALDTRPVMAAADAAFDLMRIPHRDELPPSLSEALDADVAVARIDPAAAADLTQAYRDFAARFGARVLAKDEPPDGADAVWLLGRDAPGAARWRETMDRSIVSGASRVMVVREATGTAVVLVDAESAAAASAVAARLPHYGRYGLLGFDADRARNVFKGELPVDASPMQVVLDAGWERRPLPLAPEHALSAPDR